MRPSIDLTPEQQRIVNEIRRVAEHLGQRSLSQNQFDQHHRFGGVSTAGYQFGSWNDAVKAAGLQPLPSGQSARPQYSDRELLQDIIRVHRELGEAPNERKMARLGRYSLKPYKDRWGTFTKARQEAYAVLGSPEQA